MDLVESYAEDLRFARKPFTRALLALVLAALAAFPWLAPDWMVFLATLVALYSIGVMGQNILIGYTGQISFGQAGFLAIGAFGFGHLRIWGAPFPAALLGAGLAAGLAIAKLKPMFGMSTTRYEYYLYVLLLALFTLATYNLISSYVGRAFIAIRDSDIAAEVNGINLTRYKLLAFAISSFYTGVHGALYAQVLGHIEPQIFNIGESLTLFVAVIIGGVASVEGALLGAVFVQLVPHWLGLLNLRELVPVVFGVAILVVLMFEPLGLFGRWLKTRLYFQLWPFR